jgi:uncharacterized protein (TIGR02145 family)
MKKNKLFFLFALVFFACANVPAQVTIGGLTEPVTGTLLNLNSANRGGLLLSNVTITNLDSIPYGRNLFSGITKATADVNMELCGAMVYNTGLGTTVPAGIYIWTGRNWTKDGRFDPAVLRRGVGTFIGKNRFDLALGNDGINSCGSVSGRQSQKTNFSNRTPQDGTTAPYSGVQVYTFTPRAGDAVSHVRFAYVETSGVSIDSIKPASSHYATADNINYACKVTVYYRAALNSELQGTTRTTGHKLKLYVIYNFRAEYSSPSNDIMLDLNISLQDCSACGAYTDKATGTWLNFMCHNLGAIEGADPLKPAATIQGGKYKWGVKAIAMTQEEEQDDGKEYSTSEWLNRGTPPTDTNVDWDMKDANPCPAGWRVPTRTEWASVLTNNAKIWEGNWKTVNYSSGLRIGDALFLPTAGFGYDTDGSPSYPGKNAYYWSSTAVGPNGNCLKFDKDNGNVATVDYVANRIYGFSVRCVAN